VTSSWSFIRQLVVEGLG